MCANVSRWHSKKQAAGATYSEYDLCDVDASLSLFVSDLDSFLGAGIGTRSCFLPLAIDTLFSDSGRFLIRNDKDDLRCTLMGCRSRSLYVFLFTRKCRSVNSLSMREPIRRTEIGFDAIKLMKQKPITERQRSVY